MKANSWMATALLLALLPLRDRATEATASGQALQWVRFEDPLEHAFSVEVPRGWMVKGGLFRLGWLDQRPMLDLTSADGLINVRIGDIAVPRYIMPDAQRPAESRTFDQGSTAQNVVARYRTGPEFAVLYAHARFAGLCHHARTDAADADFMMPDYVPVDEASAPTSTGQIAYHCDADRDAHIGFAFVRTRANGAYWSAHSLASFFSPSQQSALARSVLLHAVHSYQLLEAGRSMAEETSLNAPGTAWNLDESTRQRLESRMDALRRTLDAFVHQQGKSFPVTDAMTAALSGVRPTAVPLSRQNTLLWDGPDTLYWTNGTGEVLNAPSAPSAAWHALAITTP